MSAATAQRQEEARKAAIEAEAQREAALAAELEREARGVPARVLRPVGAGLNPLTPMTGLLLLGAAMRRPRTQGRI